MEPSNVIIISGDKNMLSNDELADRLEDNPSEYASEAAARLRTFTLLSKAHQRLANDSVDYESNLLKKLKIAEDALEKCVNYNNSWELEAAKENAKNALHAIHGKGENNGK